MKTGDQKMSSRRRPFRHERWSLVLRLVCLVPPFSFSASVAQQQASQTGVLPPAPTYQLHSGDTISVSYRLTPEYNQSLTILPDGYVDLRLIGPVHVAGLAVEQVRQAILTEANKHLRDPEVSVSVTEFVRDQFTVMGEVGKPGRFELHGPTSLVDALALASGFTSLSAQKRVVLVRPLAPKSEYGNATIFDFKHLLGQNSLTAVPTLQNGDIVIVTTSKFAKITGIIRLLNVGIYYNPLSTL